MAQQLIGHALSLLFVARGRRPALRGQWNVERGATFCVNFATLSLYPIAENLQLIDF
ncbi:hypothetical protein [Pseudomonas sp. NR3]|uniref:hypothetical protein n=1 Tax=unclassified Pseudomonas TaxID=196821 RepID=UPI003B685645